MTSNDNNAIIFILENTFPGELERIRKKGYSITPLIEGYAIYKEEHWAHVLEQSAVAERTYVIDYDGDMFIPTSFEARCLVATAQRMEGAGNAITFDELIEAWNMSHEKKYWSVANSVSDASARHRIAMPQQTRPV